MKFIWCLLSLLALLPVTTGINPGVEVKLTQKGLEYGKCALHSKNSLLAVIRNEIKPV